jgi:GNAT superfamily N-acetyltransferase
MTNDTLVVPPAPPGDRELAFAIKRAALGPYVVRVWGWDDDFHLAFLAADWAVHRRAVLELDDVPVGTLEVVSHADRLELGEFYLLPAHQRRGIGSELLRRVLGRADAGGQIVRLQFLKVNPVRSLYERHGFRVVGESGTHYHAERAPRPAAGRHDV